MILQRNRTTAIAFILVLTIAPMFIACLPAADAQWFTFPRTTTAYMFLSPNPIGVNQLLLVQAWIVPRPLYPLWYYYNYKFTFTDPDGQTETITIPRSEQTGSTWLNYKPDKVGTWTVQFTWDGSDTPSGPSGNETAAATEKQPLVVQQAPIPSWPAAPLPTDGLTWPINPENREWARIAGSWWKQKYNFSTSYYNPYSIAPASSHILWKIPPVSGLGGIVGGSYPWPYYSASVASVYCVMAGKAYYASGGNIYCVDIRSGQQLWKVPGSFTTGIVPGMYAEPRTAPATAPELWSVGTRLIKYNAFTGAMILNVTGAGSATFMVDTYIYTLNVARGYIVKWNGAGSSSNLASRVVYNVTYPFVGDGMVWAVVDRNVAAGISSDTLDSSGGLNLTTGAKLWSRNITDIELDMAYGAGYGKVYYPTADRRIVALNPTTGDITWTSDQQMSYPWGNFGAYTHCTAFGNIYQSKYFGLISLNATTGHVNWIYNTGNSMPTGETPYGTWPLYHGPMAADGKIYMGTGEWGEMGTIIYRGQKMHCVDGTTGKGLWSIMGLWNPTAVAEGTLFATNAYDAYSYAFGKGPTLTEVSTDISRIAKGESVWISGRVTDQSPAQPGTPAVSKESMSDWLEYLHMQQTMPLDTVGVPVDLYATHSNGTTYKIATVTSDGQGYFKYKWTPPNEDHYYVSANFMGDESYYSSWNLTSLAVGSAPQPAPEYPQPIAPTDYTPMFAGLIAAVVVVAIIGVANLFALRKSRK